MSPPRAVAFDIMDTVLHDPYRAALEAATGLTAREIRERRDPEVWPRFERAEITEAEFFAAYGVEIDVEVFHDTRRSGYGFVDGMDRLLDELEGDVVRVAATNYPIWLEELEADLLAGCFEHVVSSHRLGVRKPDPDFYRQLCETAGADASEVLFVDDRAPNVAAAEAAGLRAHRFAGTPDLRERLRREGVDVALN
ncbi:MAG: HAD-IA family hydrolase [Nitriliruptorales bacterium]